MANWLAYLFGRRGSQGTQEAPGPTASPSSGILRSSLSDQDLAHTARIHDTDPQDIGYARAASQVKWPQDAESPDFAHLKWNGESNGRFRLRSDDLELLATMNDFPAGRTGDTPILFGLRGCRILRSAQTLEDEIELSDVRPSHQAIGYCSIGVWDRANRRVAGFPASTVPMASIVLDYYNRETNVGNILATGFYGYIVGNHCTGTESNLVCRPGCFLLRVPSGDKRIVAVRRSRNNTWYDLKDIVDLCPAGDNIHPSFRDSEASFSSFGCQVVHGFAQPGGHHRGPWAKFRIAAGMTDADGDPGRSYDYMLLTGLEAMVASRARENNTRNSVATVRHLRRLRYGSEGEAVQRLQTFLGVSADGKLGPGAAEALYKKQHATFNGACDGIFSPDLDAQFGTSVLQLPHG